MPSWAHEALMRVAIQRISIEDDAADRPYSWLGEPGAEASRREYERKVMERRAAGLPDDPYAA